jgi:DNA-binding MarR family transcriptional regulator
MSEESKKIARQNEVIISLLGRIAFTSKQVREIVTSKKREDLKQKYITGYNALDGKRSVSEIASIIGVTQGTISPILFQWEELGIIYEIERTGGKFYKKLFPI